MNDTQRKVLLIVAGVVALMVLFPPFAARVSNGTNINFGYSFITDPPNARATINTSVLLAQIAASCVIGCALFFAFGGERAQSQGGKGKGVIVAACIAAVAVSVGFVSYSNKKEEEVRALEQKLSAPKPYNSSEFDDIFGITPEDRQK